MQCCVLVPVWDMIGVKNPPLFVFPSISFSIRMTYKCKMSGLYSLKWRSCIQYGLFLFRWSDQESPSLSLFASLVPAFFVGCHFICSLPASALEFDLEIGAFWIQVRTENQFHISWMWDCISVCLATIPTEHVQTSETTVRRRNHHPEFTRLYDLCVFVSPVA